MVGLFVVVAFIMLSLVVFFISGVYFFREGYQVYIRYDYVDILDKGAPVRMAGVRVGEVNQVELVHGDNGKTEVKVRIFLERNVKVHHDYKFEIRGTHILSEPHIEITPIPSQAPLLKNGSHVEGEKLLPIESLIEHAHHVAQGLDQIVNGKLEDAEGDTKEMVKQLKATTERLNQMVTGIDEGKGTVGKLVATTELHDEMKGLISEIKARPWRLLKKDNEKKKRFFFF